MYVRNWKTANKKALRINGTPLFLQETVYTFSSICQILFQIFFGISECAKCSAFVFQCVHILFMIHSKNFHSLIMPNSFFPFILPNVSEMSQNIFRYMLYTLFSQYFILILFEYNFFQFILPLLQSYDSCLLSQSRRLPLLQVSNNTPSLSQWEYNLRLR